MTVPYTFGTATTSIPLSNLDANFNTPITLGNTSIYLGNTTTTIGNLTLTNATISSGNVTISNISVTTANVTTANVATLSVTGTATIATANITTGNITTLTSTSITDSGLTSGRVTFAGASGLLSDSANLTFSGTSLGVTGGISVNQNSVGTVAEFVNSDTTNGYGVSIQAGGTAATRYALTVRNPAGNQDWLKVSSVTGEVGNTIFAPGAPGSSEVARFTTTGLLIGTTANTNSAKLKSKVSAGAVGFEVTDEASSDFVVIPAFATSVCKIGPTAGALAIQTAGTEQMRISSDGNLLVGTTSFTAGGKGFVVRNDNAGGTYTQIGATSTSAWDVAYFYNPNGLVGSITVSGSATAYNTSSDQRLKTNVVDAPSGNIDSIKVRSFDWIADGNHQEYGVVAQELIEVAPYAVNKPENPDEMMGVDYSKLVPMMIKEIQDLKAEVNQLKAKIGV
jgi:hypothetical protein